MSEERAPPAATERWFPVLAFVREGRRHRDRGALALLVALVLVALLLAAMPLSGAAARLLMARFHLRTRPFALWALLQPVPSMYNFENRIWISPRPLGRDELRGAAPPGVESRLLNHYPLRIFTFFEGRSYVLREGKDRWVYARSRYRGRTVWSGYHLRLAPGAPLQRLAGVAEPVEVPGED